MARFTSELPPEQIAARLTAFAGEIPLGDGMLQVEERKKELKVIFRADEGGKEGKVTIFHGRIRWGKHGGSVIRGRCGKSPLVSLIIALPLGLAVLLALTFIGPKRGLARNRASITEFLLRILTDVGFSFAMSIAVLYLCFTAVCFLLLLSMDINVREQANRKIIYEFLKEQVCGQTETKERER